MLARMGAALAPVPQSAKPELLHDLSDLAVARQALLKNDGPAPDAPFDGLKVLLPARENKNRHALILLTLDATDEAMQKAEQEHCA